MPFFFFRCIKNKVQEDLQGQDRMSVAQRKKMKNNFEYDLSILMLLVLIPLRFAEMCTWAYRITWSHSKSANV